MDSNPCATQEYIREYVKDNPDYEPEQGIKPEDVTVQWLYDNTELFNNNDIVDPDYIGDYIRDNCSDYIYCDDIDVGYLRDNTTLFEHEDIIEPDQDSCAEWLQTHCSYAEKVESIKTICED